MGWFALPGQSLAQPEAEHVESVMGTAESDAFATHLTTALEAFEARDFAKALENFDRAIALGRAPGELATLHFNAGVCAFELGRFSEAEQRFETAADLDTEDADSARVHAGFAALRAGALERAASHANAVSPTGREQPLARELAKEIADAHAAHRRQMALDSLRAAFASLSRDDYDAAERELTRTQSLATTLTASERGDLHYALARVAEKRGRAEQALTHLQVALASQPEACELHRYEGRLLERAGRIDDAVASQRRALACAKTSEEAELAQDDIDALHPLGPSGFRGYAELSTGYDSNAAQSGTARGLDTANPGAMFVDPSATSPVIPSALLGLDGRLAFYHRLAFDWALVPRFSTANLMLLETTVRGSSLSVQELALGLAHAPTMTTRVELYVGGAELTSDVPPFSPLSEEGFVGAEAELRPVPGWALWAGSRFTGVEGTASAPSLTGFRIESDLGVRHFTRALSAALRARLSWNSAGVVTVGGNPMDFDCEFGFSRFSDDCDPLSFDVPASYLAPALELQLGYWLSDYLRVAGSAGVQYRHYLAPTRAYREPMSVLVAEKTRQDLAFETAIELRVFPWTDFDAYAFARESARFNVSNMRPDPDDPDHRFDYEDRNYTQFVTTVGVGAAF